jgi:hypothetical protein
MILNNGEALLLLIGLRRLSGRDVGELTSRLNPDSVSSGLQYWMGIATKYIPKAIELPRKWYDAENGMSLCLSLMRTRKALLAVTVAAEEFYERHEVSRTNLVVLMTVTEHFDMQLRKHIDILSTLTDVGYYDRELSELSQEFREPLPWWLDGCMAEACLIRRAEIEGFCYALLRKE